VGISSLPETRRLDSNNHWPRGWVGSSLWRQMGDYFLHARALGCLHISMPPSSCCLSFMQYARSFRVSYQLPYHVTKNTLGSGLPEPIHLLLIGHMEEQPLLGLVSLGSDMTFLLLRSYWSLFTFFRSVRWEGILVRLPGF
jgi:hypothetical protein